MKLHITIPDELGKRMRQVCEEEGFNYSEYIRGAVRNALYDSHKKEVGSKVPSLKKSETPAEKTESSGVMVWENRDYMPVMKEKYTGFCNANRAHSFERGKVREIFDIAVLNAEENQVFKGAMCMECIEWFKKNVISQGGRIE